MIAVWRVLSHDPADGPWNMALDEAIARAVETRAALPTIRFYAWAKPTVSLGNLQTSRRTLARDECGRRGVGIVRRPTGGRAVLHHHEITYSVSVPLAGVWKRLSVGESFRLIGEGLVAGLRRLGVAATLGRDDGALPVAERAEACFQVPRMPAVLAMGRKIIGSAQRRWEGSLLQHGSVLLGLDLDLHQAVFPAWPRDDPGKGVTSLRDLMPTMPDRAEIEQALLEGWKEVLQFRDERGHVAASERREAERLVAARYGTPAWTWRR